MPRRLGLQILFAEETGPGILQAQPRPINLQKAGVCGNISLSGVCSNNNRGGFRMASMIDGESYLGRVMIRPLSESGDITLYLWPMRCLKSKMGGPTFGVDVKGEEILRFDAHGPRGHWHKGGYDKLGPGGSHQEFPEGLQDIEGQISWGLAHIKEQGQQLLEESGHTGSAASIDPEMVGTASEAILAHLATEGDLRPRAVEQGLVAP